MPWVPTARPGPALQAEAKGLHGHNRKAAPGVPPSSAVCPQATHSTSLSLSLPVKWG